jgi:hypothetical protein
MMGRNSRFLVCFRLPFSNPLVLSFSPYPNAIGSSIGYRYGSSTFGGMGLSVGLDLQAGISIPLGYDTEFRNRIPT